MALRQAVDERPEADALDDAADAKPAALGSRHAASLAKSASRTQPAEATERLRETATGLRQRHRCTLIAKAASVPEEDTLPDVETSVIAPEALDDLLVALAGRGFRVLGPTRARRARSSTTSSSRRPTSRSAGRTSRSRAATGSSAATTRRASATRSARTRGSSSCCPPRVRLWQARRGPDGFEVEEEPLEDPPLALIGVRACELHAIVIQDRVLPRRPLRRPRLRGAARGRVHRRRQLLRARRHLLLHLDGHRAEGEGRLRPGADRDPRRRASPARRGRERARRRGARRAAAARRRSADDLAAAGAAVAGAAERMGRQLDTTDIRDLLARNLDNERWDEVASRCLTCGNCTLVCPTCFCTSVEDVTDLTGEHAERDAGLGLLLLGRPLLHPRRQHPAVGPLALPPVADAQVRHLARPVRQLRLRRLRAVHHLVPGRDRRDRGADRDPRERGSRRWRRLKPCCTTCRSSRG